MRRGRKTVTATDRCQEREVADLYYQIVRFDHKTAHTQCGLQYSCNAIRERRLSVVIPDQDAWYAS